jgi:DNA-binding transcriptional regulator YiaG
MDAVGRELKQLKGSVRKKPVAAPSEDQNEGVHRRFSAERLAATRSKLGLFAADFGTLMGVRGQSIYKWRRKRRGPAKQLAAIVSVRGIGKRDAMQRLEVRRAAV